eukprot:CAMPEP_0198341924 /NCGR_PEP_ID=MMETSP1450-20131203/50284_1 /TAXON_ID=753684 ORGANISM="Madagascaria erythrocladiodes, Strain CCMP3234" /NCGR_SAMPLE_ID=MMETSP1450 /ASSEMBLY_ACC=CAM_ASM_001115 /LENGTH=53 /DNA_ID=CAMNT_0044046985 /DNA_START=73 /DNA_END=230 /DNA_ORIENTATION=+
MADHPSDESLRRVFSVLWSSVKQTTDQASSAPPPTSRMQAFAASGPARASDAA